MKFIILGGGLTGCTIAYLLKQKGHDITIIEQDKQIGGMCKTYYKNGLKYEYGPHIFYSENKKIIEFITKIIKVKATTVLVSAYVQGQLMDYPVSVSNIFKLREKEQILEELYHLNPNNPDYTNFETYVKSLMGKTLYKLFVYNYTKKFWGIEPKKLTADWAPRRISFRVKDKRLFKNSWQAYPDPDYNIFFKRLTKNIPIIHKKISSYKVGYFGEKICISTIPIDLLCQYKFGHLPYRGYKLKIEILNKEHFWPRNCAWVTFPNNYKYTRICEYKHYNLQKHPKTLISKEYPGKSPFHYPINTVQNEKLFNKYLKKICRQKNLITMGRLGLYAYLPMDKAIEMSMCLVDRIGQYQQLHTANGRFNFHKIIRALY